MRYVVLLPFLMLGCSKERDVRQEITLATTTSTQDSGLLDVLLPAFAEESGIYVKVVALGSGQALELGRRGDADLLLTHSPEAERNFMQQGWGREARPVMHNDFVVVGPPLHKLNLGEARTAAEAFRNIAKTRSTFISRADESGTHQKELSIWKQAEITPQDAWYVRSGSGMAQALRMAHEKKAFTLCDRGTYLALKNELELVVLIEGDSSLLNRYSIITVNPDKHPHIRHAQAERLATFLLSARGQGLIETFGVERYGQPLFFPNGK